MGEESQSFQAWAPHYPFWGKESDKTGIIVGKGNSHAPGACFRAIPAPRGGKEHVSPRPDYGDRSPADLERDLLLEFPLEQHPTLTWALGGVGNPLTVPWIEGLLEEMKDTVNSECRYVSLSTGPFWTCPQ